MISNKNKKWLEVSFKIAELSDFYPYKMGCIAVKGGRVIRTGVNRISPGRLKDKRYHFKGVHCELDLTLNLDKDYLKGSTVYIAGLTQSGNKIHSKPCGICAQRLADYGVRKVYYLDKQREIACERISPSSSLLSVPYP